MEKLYRCAICGGRMIYDPKTVVDIAHSAAWYSDPPKAKLVHKKCARRKRKSLI